MPAFLAGEAAAVEEGLLIGRGGAAEDGVAMREAAEPADDVGVQLRPLQLLGVANGAKQRAAALLVGGGLGMLERQIEELPTVGRRLQVEAAGDGAFGHRARQWIGGIASRVGAEHVARKLIEHDDERERAIARALPAGERSCGRRFVGGEEAGADRVVERSVLLEPLVLAGFAPEREYVFGAGDHWYGRPRILRHRPRRRAIRYSPCLK